MKKIKTAKQVLVLVLNYDWSKLNVVLSHISWMFKFMRFTSSIKYNRLIINWVHSNKCSLQLKLCTDNFGVFIGL